MSGFCKRMHGLRAVRGQNLAELVVILPLLFVVCFVIVELGRAWQTYEASRMATADGAYTAAATNSPGQGALTILNRLAQANVTPAGPPTIIPIVGRGEGATILGYKAQVRVQFTPIIGGITVPGFNGPVVLVPNAFFIDHTEIFQHRVM